MVTIAVLAVGLAVFLRSRGNGPAATGRVRLDPVQAGMLTSDDRAIAASLTLLRGAELISPEGPSCGRGRSPTTPAAVAEGVAGAGAGDDHTDRAGPRDRVAAGDLRDHRPTRRPAVLRGDRRILPARRRGVGVPDELRSLGVPVVHGISLSLGGADAVEQRRIDHLARCADALGAPLVSEYVAFVRAGGLEAGHLLPVPHTEEALDALVRNIRRTQECLPVPLAVENIAALFDWPEDEYSEGEFLAELVDRTGVHLLLDVADVYANARNRGRDAGAELRRLPLERVAYCHVAGGRERDGVYHDTHTDPVPGEVLDLVREWASEGAPAMMLERDGNYPPACELFDELDAIADAAGFDRITRSTAQSLA